MRKQKRRLNKKNLAIYLLLGACIWLLVANYDLKGETVWSGTADHYATKITIVRK